MAIESTPGGNIYDPVAGVPQDEDTALNRDSRDLELLSRMRTQAVSAFRDLILGGKNLYDPNALDAMTGYVLGGSVPYAVESPSYSVTGFIGVKPGEQYTLSNPRNAAVYDAEQQFVSGSWVDNAAQGPYTVTIPVTGALLRASVHNDTYKATFQIEKGSVATAYEPHVPAIGGGDAGVTIDEVATAALDDNSSLALAVDTRVDSAIDRAPLLQLTAGKNLYDYTADSLDSYINAGSGQWVFTLANFRASAEIPVESGKTYTISHARHWSVRDPEGVSVLAGEARTSQAVVTFTAPGDGLLRFSYNPSTGGADPAGAVQVEEGSVATAHAPHGRKLDLTGYEVVGLDGSGGASPDAPLSVTRVGSLLTITADHDGKALEIGADLSNGNNKVFNFTGTKLNGATVHGVSDEPAPIRTQHGTIGANHGFALLAVWEAADHDKATADLGSVWTSGGREFVLLGFDTSGRAFFGGDYTTDVQGVSRMSTITLTENLTHVSGATNTTAVDYAKKLGQGVRQLWPAVQRIRQAVILDGATVGEGVHTGRELEVRESYDILEYASLYDSAKANIGVPHTDRTVGGCVRVETVYRFREGGVAAVDVNLTETTPTALNACGLVQSGVLSGTVTRYVPGVKSINGKDWSAGVPLATYAETQIVKSTDLHNPTAPPLMSVDVRSDVAFVLGVKPWQAGVTHASTRLAESASNLWDLRSTKKSYPTVVAGSDPGWVRMEGHAVRAYLTPAQAASITAAGADAYGAWAALETVTALP